MTTRIFDSSVKALDSLVFPFDSSEIRRPNKNKKIKRLKKKDSFFQKNGLSKARQNKAGMVIAARPKTSTPIAITKTSNSSFVSHIGHYVLNKELGKSLPNGLRSLLLIKGLRLAKGGVRKMGHDYITSGKRNAHCDLVLVVAIVQSNISLTPVLISVFFGGEKWIITTYR